MTVGQLRKLYAKRAIEREKVIESFSDQVVDLLELPAIMNTKQLAFALQLSSTAIYELIYRPGFYPKFMVGKNIRISRDALIEWINQQCSNKCEPEAQGNDCQQET